MNLATLVVTVRMNAHPEPGDLLIGVHIPRPEGFPVIPYIIVTRQLYAAFQKRKYLLCPLAVNGLAAYAIKFKKADPRIALFIKRE